MAWANGPKDLIGTWVVEKARSLVDGKFDFFTMEDVAAELDRRKAAGDLDGDPSEMMAGFTGRTEFTEDGKVRSWMKLPEGVSEDQIQAALAAGEIIAYSDGYFCHEEKEWKEEDGKLLYNSGEHREIFGEVKSPWDPLELNEDGLLPFGSGMVLLRKLGM